MKKTLAIALMISTYSLCFAQDEKSKSKEPLTFEVSFNGKQHVVKQGDTVELGYGSYPHGGFMYVGPNAVGKEFAKKTGIVKKVQYFKPLAQYKIMVKMAGGLYLIDLPQAVEKEEVIRFNGVTFK